MQPLLHTEAQASCWQEQLWKLAVDAWPIDEGKEWVQVAPDEGSSQPCHGPSAVIDFELEMVILFRQRLHLRCSFLHTSDRLVLTILQWTGHYCLSVFLTAHSYALGILRLSFWQQQDKLNRGSMICIYRCIVSWYSHSDGALKQSKMELRCGI